MAKGWATRAWGAVFRWTVIAFLVLFVLPVVATLLLLAVAAVVPSDPVAASGVVFGGVLAVVAAGLVLRHRFRAKRARDHHEALVRQFGVEGAANIAAKRLWRGAPEAAVILMFGLPSATGAKVTKQLERRIWKFRPGPRGGFGLVVDIEDGVVVGWEAK